MNDKIEKIYNLSTTQKGIYFHILFNEKSIEYVGQNILLYNGQMIPCYVEQSLSLLAIKHEVLRTAFVNTTRTGDTLQVILREREIELNIRRVRTDQEQEELARQDIQRGFDLKKDSLLRLTLLQKESNETVILWTMHHIITDGWCLGLLFGDFLMFYKKLETGSPFEVLKQEALLKKDQNASYSDYIHWLEAQDKEAGLQYWEGLLEDYEETAVIKPLGAGEATGGTGTVELQIDKQTSEKIFRLAQEEKVTVNNVAEAAWGIVLQKYNRTNDVVFGKVVSGRDVPLTGIEETVGLFINTIPLRVKHEDKTTVRELLRSVNRQGLESSKYDYCSLAEVQGRSKLGRNLFNTLFVFENYFVDDMLLNELIGEEHGMVTLGGNTENTNYDITIYNHCSDMLKIELQYNNTKFSKNEMMQILDRIHRVILQFVENPEIQVRQIDVLSPGELDNIVRTFNNTSQKYPSNKTIVDLFEEQVERTRSEERRVGKECLRLCRSRWSPYH